jgi:hypothetical protein
MGHSVGRDEILSEMRRLALANGGRPLGRSRFEREAGITPYDWGRYWAKFSDAQREAGLTVNTLNQAHDEDALLEKYATLVLALGRIPTNAEVRLRREADPSFPSRNVFARFGKKDELVTRVAGYCAGRPEFAAVVEICLASSRVHAAAPEPEGDRETADGASGFVYLIAGRRGEYKLGHSSVVERRLSELGTGSAVPLQVVHEIKTDDPLGIEAYWHRRLEGKRMRGEWFSLSAADVKAFKRWRRIY